MLFDLRPASLPISPFPEAPRKLFDRKLLRIMDSMLCTFSLPSRRKRFGG